MSINKIVASALVGAAVSFAGFAQADVVFTKTTDGTKFEITDPKAFGDTKKKDNVKTAAEIEFLKTGKISMSVMLKLKKEVRKDLVTGHVLNVMDQQQRDRLDLV